MWNAWPSSPSGEDDESTAGDRDESGRQRVRCQISVSLDGYVAGPDQSVEAPLGTGGEQLHEWVTSLAEWRRQHGLEGGEVTESTEVLEAATAGIGATVMGRNMFGGHPGDWGDGSWRGWWGDEPPFHHPVFVVTHHPRETLELGDTTFEFVTDGVRAAVDRARDAAGGKDVAIGGGAETVRQAITSGLLDEMWLHVVPVLLGAGERLFPEGEAPAAVKQRAVIAAPGVTHLKLEFDSAP
ncbi:MAG: dihydrofolate reductase family protein [Actinomycetota bacterium]|nr:dihydrofolate reductase family protein [Actinomycetota bacterium]